MSKRLALITGASTGIGAELAKQMAARGYRLALVARRKPLLEALALELESRDCEAKVYQADVVNWEEIRQTVERVEAEQGPIDMLIANAGVTISSGVRNFDVHKAREVYDVNVIGLMQTIAAVMPFMIKRQRGHIVGVSSLASYFTVPRTYPYCASKAAASAHLEGLRMELLPYKIKVSTVCPGFIKSPMTADVKVKMPFLMDLDKAVKQMLDRIERGEQVINFPWPLYMMIRGISLLPMPLVRQLIQRATPKGGGKVKSQGSAMT